VLLPDLLGFGAHRVEVEVGGLGLEVRARSVQIDVRDGDLGVDDLSVGRVEVEPRAAVRARRGRDSVRQRVVDPGAVRSDGRSKRATK